MVAHLPSAPVFDVSLKDLSAGVVIVTVTPSTGLPAESVTRPVTRPCVPATAGRLIRRMAIAARDRIRIFIVTSNRREATRLPAEFQGISDPVERAHRGRTIPAAGRA